MLNKAAFQKNPRRFLLGVNYLPRETGVHLWKHWDASIVDRDFAAISSMGYSLVRIFLIWEDFQPLREYRGFMGKQVLATRIGSKPLSRHAPAVDTGAVDKFDEMLDTAERHGLKLIPTFFVGWMSGTVFDVSWREGRNIFSDPYMLRRQAELVAYFAGRYAGDDRIFAWDLGNEQNCFMECHSLHDAWLWTNLLVKEIKTHDHSHPVTSGMCLELEGGGDFNFLIQDISELLDFACVHPYPVFRPMCIDRLNNLRTSYLPAFEHCLQRDIGRRPVLCEEFSGLCSSRISQQVESKYVKIVLHSLLANGCMGALYWCYTDFISDTDLPYSASPLEKHLGLVNEKGAPGPVALEIKAFSDLLAQLDIGSWQAEDSRAAIVIPRNPSTCALLFNSYILSRMAGFDVKFVLPDEDLSPFKLIILPAFADSGSFSLPEWEKLKHFVAEGGVLYMSYKGMAVADMDSFFGVSISGNEVPEEKQRKFKFAESSGVKALSYTGSGSPVMLVEPTTAEAVSVDGTDSPNIVINRYAKGHAILATEPVEEYIAGTPGRLTGGGMHLFYRYLADLAGLSRTLISDSPFIEHKRFSKDTGTVDYLINHGDSRQSCILSAPESRLQVLMGHGEAEMRSLDALGTQVFIEAAGAVLIESCSEPAKRQQVAAPDRSGSRAEGESVKCR